MRLEIQDVLGVEYANIEIPEPGIVEIAGPNAAGKSSVAAAAQAVLAYNFNPLGVPAAQGKRIYIREGADHGDATLMIDGKVVRWRPAAGTMETPNITPAPSRPEAVGLVDFTARTGAKQRAEQLQAALLPPHGQIMADVKAALADYIGGEDLSGVIEMILERGFDAAASVYADRARRAKQEWREITGATWGIKVGSDWYPVGWQADYDGLTVQDAEAAVVAARDALAALHTVQAVTDAEIEAARRARDTMPALQQAKDAADEHANVLNDDRVGVDAAIDDAQRAVNAALREYDAVKDRQVCPHCQGDLMLDNGVIRPAVFISPDRVEELAGAWQAALRERDGLMERSRAVAQELGEARQAQTEAGVAYAAAKSRAQDADKLPTPDNSTAIAAAEADVERARDVVRLVQAARSATTLHDTVIRYSEAAKAIGPQGIRQRMMVDGIAALNSGLHRISSMTGWAAMQVDERGDMTWAGRPVQMGSESERWRAQAAMQLTIAALTKSRVVVLDRVDILDDRAALAKALQTVSERTGVSIMICATETAANPAWWPVVRIERGRTAEGVA